MEMVQRGDTGPEVASEPVDPSPAVDGAVASGRHEVLARSIPARQPPRLLAFAFATFSSARVIAYFPMIFAIYQSGESGQHSLVTWFIWLGSHATMAAWLYWKEGASVDKAIVVSACNALMCLVSILVIAWFRF